MLKSLLFTSFIRTRISSISCNFITCRQSFLCSMWCQRTSSASLRQQWSRCYDRRQASFLSIFEEPLLSLKRDSALTRSCCTQLTQKRGLFRYNKPTTRRRQSLTAAAIISHGRTESVWIIKAELISFSNLFFYYYSTLTQVCFSFCELHKKTPPPPPGFIVNLCKLPWQ